MIKLSIEEFTFSPASSTHLIILTIPTEVFMSRGVDFQGLGWILGCQKQRADGI